MKTHKVGWSAWFLTVFLAAVIALGVKVIVMLLAGEVAMEDGPMDPTYARVLAIVSALVLLTWLISVLTMLRQLIFYRGTELTLTHEGIEHTTVTVVILAFVLVLPIKFIPWEAVTYYGKKDGHPYVKVDTGRVKASFVAKAILKASGYAFCGNACRPPVTVEEVERYQHRFQPNK